MGLMLVRSRSISQSSRLSQRFKRQDLETPGSLRSLVRRHRSSPSARYPPALLFSLRIPGYQKAAGGFGFILCSLRLVGRRRGGGFGRWSGRRSIGKSRTETAHHSQIASAHNILGVRIHAVGVTDLLARSVNQASQGAARHRLPVMGSAGTGRRRNRLIQSGTIALRLNGPTLDVETVCPGEREPLDRGRLSAAVSFLRTHGLEIRPILDKQLDRWYLSFNRWPTRSFHGAAQTRAARHHVLE